MSEKGFKVICISTYDEDLAEMDAKVQALKALGWTKMSRSQLIRMAVDRVDIDALHADTDYRGYLPPKSR